MAFVIKTILLGVSLVANLTLTGLLLDASTSGQSRAEHSSAVSPGRVAAQAPAATSAASYYQGLLTLGLSEHEAKRLLFAELEDAAVAGIDQPVIRYWQNGLAPAAGYRLAVAAAERGVRAQLEDLFGAAAVAAPEFVKLYRPLGAELDFLDSGAQIALNEWRLDEATLHPAQRLPSNATSSQAGSPAPYNVPPVLTADDAFEYALRISPLADALRASDIDFTESEFRNAYRTLAAVDTAAGDPAAQLEARRALREELGAQRSDHVWARLDPTFGSLAAVAADLGLGQATVDAAYGVMNDAQERLLAWVASGAADSRRSVGPIHDIRAEERRRLEDLVGAAAADRLLRARASGFFALSRQAESGARPPP